MAEETPDQRDADTLEKQGREQGHPQKAVKSTEATLGRHRDLIIVTLSLLSVVIGYMAWKGKGKKPAAAMDNAAAASDAAAASSTDLTGLPTSGGLSNGYVVGSGSGDGNTAADVSNALNGFQSYLDNLTHELAANNTPADAGGTLSASPLGFTYGPSAKGLTYVKDDRTGGVYQVEHDGTLFHLSPGQYAALGSPSFVQYNTPRPRNAPPPRRLPHRPR